MFQQYGNDRNSERPIDNSLVWPPLIEGELYRDTFHISWFLYVSSEGIWETKLRTSDNIFRNGPYFDKAWLYHFENDRLELDLAMMTHGMVFVFLIISTDHSGDHLANRRLAEQPFICSHTWYSWWPRLQAGMAAPMTASPIKMIYLIISSLNSRPRLASLNNRMSWSRFMAAPVCLGGDMARLLTLSYVFQRPRADMPVEDTIHSSAFMAPERNWSKCEYSMRRCHCVEASMKCFDRRVFLMWGRGADDDDVIVSQSISTAKCRRGEMMLKRSCSAWLGFSTNICCNAATAQQCRRRDGEGFRMCVRR